MALEIKLGISSIQDEFRLVDNTDVYNALTNLTGYGAPNEVPGDFNSAFIVVTMPDGTQVNAIDAYPTFPNDDNTVIFTITAAMLGVAKLEPGIYSFNYTIDDISGGISNNPFTVDCKYYHYEPIQCCISKKVKSLDFICSTNEEICEVAIAERRLKAAIYAACAGNWEETKIISDSLWEQCGCCC
tara:strand:- start:8671 stop:9228 length:558 start_codon:yes stop_codon:yes gene_type:complete